MNLSIIVQIKQFHPDSPCLTLAKTVHILAACFRTNAVVFSPKTDIAICWPTAILKQQNATVAVNNAVSSA